MVLGVLRICISGQIFSVYYGSETSIAQSHFSAGEITSLNSSVPPLASYAPFVNN